MKKEKEIKRKDMAAPRCAVGERLLFVGEHSQGQEHLGEHRVDMTLSHVVGGRREKVGGPGAAARKGK